MRVCKAHVEHGRATENPRMIAVKHAELRDPREPKDPRPSSQNSQNPGCCASCQAQTIGRQLTDRP